MSRFIGKVENTVLIASNLDAPERLSRRRAVAALLTGFHLYGWRHLGRGWIGLINDALKELDPDAKAHWDKHEDPALTRRLFCDDSVDGVEAPQEPGDGSV